MLVKVEAPSLCSSLWRDRRGKVYKPFGVLHHRESPKQHLLADHRSRSHSVIWMYLVEGMFSLRCCCFLRPLQVIQSRRTSRARGTIGTRNTTRTHRRMGCWKRLAKCANDASSVIHTCCNVIRLYFSTQSTPWVLSLRGVENKTLAGR